MSNEKRKVGNYEVIACQRIGGEEIIVGEDRNAVPSDRYLCCYVERNELMELYTHGLASDGYAEIFEIYGQRITTAAKNAIEKTDEEKAVIGGEDRVITVDKCRRKAVEIITGYATVLPPVYTGIEKPIESKKIELPEYNTDICEVRRYLKGRGISDTVIEYCHENKMLYEDAKYHNCVFLGYDGNTPKYGAVRSTVSDFKRDLTGSDKRFSFFIPAESETQTVHLFESAIDLLSFASLEIRIKRNWRRDDLLSLAGVYKTDKKQDIPLALRTYLERHTGTKAVYLHLDNDEVGRMATKQITEALSSQYTVIDQPPQSGKDFNDYLKNEIQKEKRKEQVR